MAATGGKDSPGEHKSEAELEDEVAQLAARNATLEHELAAKGSGPRHTGRGIAAICLLVIGSLLAPVSVLAVWTRNQMTDTDRYVRTIKPLAADPAIQTAVADHVTKALFDQVNLDQVIADALPEKASFLAGPLTSAVKSKVDEATRTVLASDQFQQVWLAANRLAHKQMVAVLTGKGSSTIKTENGTVLLDLSGIVDQVKQQLKDSGIDVFDRVSVPEGAVTIEIFRSEDLARAQLAFSTFDKVATILPWLTLLILAGGVLLMPNRRRGLMWAGAGVSIGVATLLLALTVARTIYLAAIPTTVLPQDAAASFFDTIIRFLRQGGRAVLAVSLLVFLGAVLFGPSGAAVRFRHWVARLLGRVGDEAGERGVDLGPVGAFVGRNLTALRVVTGVAAALVLLAWEQPTATVIFSMVLIVLVILGLLEVLGRAHRVAVERAESPAESPANTAAEHPATT